VNERNNLPPRILLVDDDPAVRRAGRRMLERRFEAVVTVAESALEAVECIESGETFQAAVLDWDMPGEHGGQLMDWIAEIDPTLPCVIWTGSGSSRVEAPRAFAVVGRKHPADLIEALERLLADERSWRRQSQLRNRVVARERSRTRTVAPDGTEEE
jgi:DNA-binding NtrC family response regulator